MIWNCAKFSERVAHGASLLIYSQFCQQIWEFLVTQDAKENFMQDWTLNISSPVG